MIPALPPRGTVLVMSTFDSSFFHEQYVHSVAVTLFLPLQVCIGMKAIVFAYLQLGNTRISTSLSPSHDLLSELPNVSSCMHKIPFFPHLLKTTQRGKCGPVDNVPCQMSLEGLQEGWQRRCRFACRRMLEMYSVIQGELHIGRCYGQSSSTYRLESRFLKNPL